MRSNTAIHPRLPPPPKERIPPFESASGAQQKLQPAMAPHGLLSQATPGPGIQTARQGDPDVPADLFSRACDLRPIIPNANHFHISPRRLSGHTHCSLDKASSKFPRAGQEPFPLRTHIFGPVSLSQSPYQNLPAVSLTLCYCCLVTHSCSALIDSVDCSPPGSSVHGVSQARVLEWVAISFSRGSSPPRDQTWVPCTAYTQTSTRVYILFPHRPLQSAEESLTHKLLNDHRYPLRVLCRLTFQTAQSIRA